MDADNLWLASHRNKLVGTLLNFPHLLTLNQPPCHRRFRCFFMVTTLNIKVIEAVDSPYGLSKI